MLIIILKLINIFFVTTYAIFLALYMLRKKDIKISQKNPLYALIIFLNGIIPTDPNYSPMHKRIRTRKQKRYVLNRLHFINFIKYVIPNLAVMTHKYVTLYLFIVGKGKRTLGDFTIISF